MSASGSMDDGVKAGPGEAEPRAKGSAGFLLKQARPFLGLALAILVVGGCQRAGMEPPEAPVPEVATDPATAPSEQADQPAVRSPGMALPSGALPVPEVEVNGVDPILHARVGQDPHLQERTEFWKSFWTSRSRGHFERYLDRMGAWDAFVDGELAARGMPASLRYLPIVESGYHHSIRSRVGATGLWQLMAPTARGLGLTVDGIVDDRRDPVASTRAALDYLTELHGQFDSWFLALSAYNAGPGRISRILARHAPDEAMPGDERYLRARAHFPAETREFVPRFFAAAALASNPEAYDLPPVNGARRVQFDEVVVPDATSLDVVATAAGVDEDQVLALNPHYHRGFTPPGAERVVRVPEGHGSGFAQAFAQIPPDERISFMEHAVAQGETLTHIARRYGVSVSELTGANGGLDPRRLQIGQRLVVPVGGSGTGGPGTSQVAQASGGADSSAGQNASGAGNGSQSQSDQSQPTVHVVSSGENLWTISRRYGVGVNELRSMNGLGNNAVLQPGQELAVGSNGAPRLHRVRPGDTWGGVAQRYGIPTSDLARANGRSTTDVIRVGEELQVPVDGN